MKKNGFSQLKEAHPVRNNSLTGFTFIELIVSVSILAIIAASIYSVFNIALHAYKRSSVDQGIQKIRTKLLKIDKELKSSFFFSGIPFRGTSSEIVFPLFVFKGDKENVRIIIYQIDRDENAEFYKLIRKEKIFTENPQDEKEEINDIFSALAIKFEYSYNPGDPSKCYEWQETWAESQKTLPSAVRISFQIDDSGEIYNKVIFLMQGALGVK